MNETIMERRTLIYFRNLKHKEELIRLAEKSHDNLSHYCERVLIAHIEEEEKKKKGA